MISWMSEHTDRVLSDIVPGLAVIVCERPPKGHVVVQMEHCDFCRQIDLGDCTGLRPQEIDRRFCEKFHLFTDEYEQSVEWCFPVAEDLHRVDRELNAA